MGELAASVSTGGSGHSTLKRLPSGAGVAPQWFSELGLHTTQRMQTEKGLRAFSPALERQTGHSSWVRDTAQYGAVLHSSSAEPHSSAPASITDAGFPDSRATNDGNRSVQWPDLNRYGINSAGISSTGISSTGNGPGIYATGRQQKGRACFT